MSNFRKLRFPRKLKGWIFSLKIESEAGRNHGIETSWTPATPGWRATVCFSVVSSCNFRPIAVADYYLALIWGNYTIWRVYRGLCLGRGGWCWITVIVSFQRSPGHSFQCSEFSHRFEAERGACLYLKEPQVIETRVFPRICYALITAKTQVKINFVQYLNFNWLFLN